MAEPLPISSAAANSRAAKSPEAFRTISEVASDLDLPQHVLRFWESKFTQIRPLKRGGGRRYYRPEDIDLLRGIRHLLYADGYTIKGVQKLIKENGVRALIDVGRGQNLRRPPVAVVPAPAPRPVLTPVPSAPPAVASGDQQSRLKSLLSELEAIRALLPRR
jgi:DNA-binding transcriptional MerR regulator